MAPYNRDALIAMAGVLAGGSGETLFPETALDSTVSLDSPESSSETFTGWSDLLGSAISQSASAVLEIRSSQTSECPPGNQSARCQRPVSSQALPIALGVTIPAVLAIAVIVYLHFKHVRNLRREEEANRGIDVDMDDYDASMVQYPPRSLTEKPAYYPDTRRSMRSMDTSSTAQAQPNFDPFTNSPYMMHPEVTASKASLNEYTRSLHSAIDNSYPSNGSVYSAGMVSPNRAMSPRFMPGQGPTPPGSRLNSLARPDSVLHGQNGYQNGQMSHQMEQNGYPSGQVERQMNPPSVTAPSSNPSSQPEQTAPAEQRWSYSSSSSGASYNTTENTAAGESTESPPSTVADTPEEMPQPPPKTYQPESTRRESIRASGDFSSTLEAPVATDSPDHSFSFGDETTQLVTERDADTSDPDLGRTNTKTFERVKSIYREYMPALMETTPEMPQHEFEEVKPEQVNQDKELPQLPEQHEDIIDQDPEQWTEPDNQQWTEPGNQQQWTEPEAAQKWTEPESNQAQQWTEPANHEAGAAQLPRTTLHEEPHDDSYEAGDETHGPFDTSSVYDNSAYWDEAPDARANHGAYGGQYEVAPLRTQLNRHASRHSVGAIPMDGQHANYNNGPYGDADYGYPPAVVQGRHQASAASFYSAQEVPGVHYRHGYSGSEVGGQLREPSRSVTPLVDLSKLPQPHNLGENDSPISYAPQQRRRKGTPEQSPIPSFNPLNHWDGSDGMALPSPHAMRQSVVMMPSLEFAPPKKYPGNASSRTHSLTSMDAPGSPALSIRSGFQTKARPFSQLVPNADDSDLLRPQMNMR